MHNFLFILILFLQVVHGCKHISAEKNSVDTISGKDPDKILVEKCTGQIDILLRDTIVFQFTEISGRGYSWSLDAPDSLSLLLKSSGVKRYMTEDKDGAGEKVQFYFIAFSRGMTVLKFRYFRPWEKNKPAADSCVTLITIK
jgi:predicted secreted protein